MKPCVAGGKYWRVLVARRHVASEANEALAIHHEHRVRDLDSAQAFALRSLRNEAHPAWNEAVRHRLARIQRKMVEKDRASQI